MTWQPAAPPAVNYFGLRYYQVDASPGFAGWLAEQQISLACTVNAGRLFLVGRDTVGNLSIADTDIERCTALHYAAPGTLLMAVHYQLWRFEQALQPGQSLEGDHDAFFLPQTAYTTGDVQLHDLAGTADGRIIFANTLFSCLATVHRRDNFTPLWQPPFITALAAADRCRLSGLALRDGQPAYVTCAAATDNPGGWREQRRSGGLVVDVASNAVVAGGLAMPYAPRWHRDRLWLVEAGNGRLGTIDLAGGSFTPVAELPGFANCLAFSGDYAVVGFSAPRDASLYADLPIATYPERTGRQLQCGLAVVDLASGTVVHRLFFHGREAREIHGLAVLPGMRRPRAAALNADEIRESITIGPSPWA